VVLKGKVPGVYDDWHDCLAQVNEFSDYDYKRYKTKEDAEARYKKHLRKKECGRMKTFFFIPILLIVIAVLLYLIVA
jgi:viroplasmin and RNaseH domain-containing protein